jgi:hypothetical protein
MRFSRELTVACASSFLGALAIASEGPLEPFASKEFWKRFDWATAEESKLWQSNQWRVFDGKQDNVATFTKKGDVTLFGTKYTANFAYLNDGKSLPHYAILVREVSKRECDKARDALNAKWGRSASNDGSIAIPTGNDTTLKFVNENYQWDFGDTRVMATCIGAESPAEDQSQSGNELVWSVKFAHKSRTKKLVPKFALTCTRTLANNLTGSTQSADDMVIWIDLFSERVSRIDLVPISDSDSFRSSENVIRFATTKGSTKALYAIDRVTGALSADIVDGEKTIGRISGRCSKSAAPVRKF